MGRDRVPGWAFIVLYLNHHAC